MSFPSRSILVAFATAGICSLACGACTSDTTEPKELATAFQRGYSEDYDPAATPRELQERSALVVRGTLSEFIQGREIAPMEGSSEVGHNITMVISVEESLFGRASKTVYVEMPSPGNVPASKYDRPSSPFPVLLYLAPADQTWDILDPTAGRPPGQPLYRPTTPQGFMAGSEAGALRVLDFEEFQGASLEDFYPDRPTFPEPSVVPEGG